MPMAIKIVSYLFLKSSLKMKTFCLLVCMNVLRTVAPCIISLSYLVWMVREYFYKIICSESVQNLFAKE